MTSNVHDIRARDPEREELAAQYAAWVAAGNMPEVVTSCRQEKTFQSQAERNAATFEDRRHDR